MNLLAPRPSLFLSNRALSDRLGADVTLAIETFQLTGSFKYRAASNVAAKVPNGHVIAASSGNFGQAIAFACMQLGKRCTVVMPATSSSVKVQAVRAYGAEVDLIDTHAKPREARVAELADQSPGAYVASAFDDPLVIEGNASLGDEIIAHGEFDVVVPPVGGGGLASGIASAFRRAGYPAELVGAEPLLGNDAARSVRSGQLESNEREPETLADGARTRSLGRHNWEILRTALSAVVEVPEDRIVEALRLLFLGANLKSEPTGALTVGAVLADPDRFSGRKVLCVVSGGNVEPALYASLIAP